MAREHPIAPPDDLAQPWLSDNYTVREIRAAGAMAVSPSEAEHEFATPWSSSTTNPSPITPPPELVASLRNSAPQGIRDAGVTRETWLVNHAYAAGADHQLKLDTEQINQAWQAGANQELEACKQVIIDQDWFCLPESRLAQLHNARRPQPSDKELALRILAKYADDFDGLRELDSDDIAILARALGALPND